MARPRCFLTNAVNWSWSAEKARLAGSFPVRDLAIFGSYARGDQRPDSDLDILVDVDPSIGLGFVALADHLEKALGLRVDLVSSRALKPRMWEAIERLAHPDVDWRKIVGLRLRINLDYPPPPRGSHYLHPAVGIFVSTRRAPRAIQGYHP